MNTQAQAHYKSSGTMSEISDNSVQLVVTSPPYPMIEMWDDQFSAQNPEIRRALDSKEGMNAFDLMHEHLRRTWEECFRVLQEGGIACINVGDATRKIGDDFQLFPNHTRITKDMVELGFTQLPGIIWRKPTNSAAKFMGSGMLGLNAYVTLEHEHILIFRKGSKRRATGHEAEARRESAYFWEERNQWFSDVWTDLKGTRQSMNGEYQKLRERSGAFPLELPLRLIEMYSVYEDTVLDPFWGTGTTSVAAAISGRNSIGYEIEKEFGKVFDNRIEKAPTLSKKRNTERLDDHVRFVEERKADGKELKYENEFYGFGVTAKQEKNIKLYDVSTVSQSGNATTFEYEPHLRQKAIFSGATTD
jgi:DNA modification methylase